MAAISGIARLDKGWVGEGWEREREGGADGERIKEEEGGRWINIWIVMEITSQ